MGLGKTVEVLALILLHSRGKGLQRNFVASFEDILVTYGLIEAKERSPVRDAAVSVGEEVAGTREASAMSRKATEESLSPVHVEVTDQQPTVTSDGVCAGDKDAPTAGQSAPLTKAAGESVSPVPDGKVTDQQSTVTPADGSDVPSAETPPEGDGVGGVVENGCDTTSDCIVCVCGVNWEEGGKEYIQCEECQAWQHTKCVGFREGPSAHYICIFCIGKNVSKTYP